MKTANTFYWSFVDTLVYNIATIAAVVVGISQFLIRAWNENNCNEKVRKAMQTLLAFVDTLVQKGKVYVADPVPAAPVTVQKVAQRRAKRS